MKINVDIKYMNDQFILYLYKIVNILTKNAMLPNMPKRCNTNPKELL
jgi:hypothetical protein